jgi:hypothetical protein
MARRRRRGRGLLTALLLLAVLVGASAGVVAWLRSHDAVVVAPRCQAALDGTDWYLSPEQADNAALLAGTALRRGLPARAATIAIATALQESGLRNLDHGHLDSLGLFQQRPSQGWGTAEEVMDPVHATDAFYDALVKVDGYQDMPITQAVQRSAFPDAYAQHETRARAWASALTGYSPAAVTCTLPAASGGDVAGVLARLDRDLGLTGTATGTEADGATVRVDARGLPGGDAEQERLAWAVAQWAVAVAEPLGLSEVAVADQVWSRESGAWAPAGSPVPAGQVELRLTG